MCELIILILNYAQYIRTYIILVRLECYYTYMLYGKSVDPCMRMGEERDQ